MNHRKRTLAALLVLLGGLAAHAQPPQAPPYGGPPGGGAYAAPGSGAAAPGASLGALGAPPYGNWAGTRTGYGPATGLAPQQALYNYYSGQAPAPPMPPDPFGPQRFHMPIPSRNDDFAGGNEKNIHTRPDEKSLGLRLDTSYIFFREAEIGAYLAEHQHVHAAALSFLPVQTPCWVIGTRLGLGWNGNTGITEDYIGATTDLFWGTRFGHTYIKVGYFVDWNHEFRKHGLSGSLLTRLGPLGNITFDGAFGYGAGADVFHSRTDLGLARRVEIADTDSQIRVGKFLSPYFQTGFSGNWADFDRARDEFGAGVFANWFVGRVTVSGDFTAGSGGARGYLVLGFNWGGGANIDAHPIDPHYTNPIDTISWVTRAPRRDITIKLRETETGVGPPQIVPVLLGGGGN